MTYRLKRLTPPHPGLTVLTVIIVRIYRRPAGILCPSITYSCRLHGNLRFYHTYADETLNGNIALVAAKVSSLTFAESVFRRVLYPFYNGE